ncbi:MAG: endo-1,4-beta-xylanase, partial [Candidatus Saccharimonadales bacterium]
YIDHTMRHFRGRIASWDVVNEPLADEVTDRNPYRQNIWYESNGVEYIAAALRQARQSDPSAKLFINEFGLEEDGDRWRVFLSLLQQLQHQQVPLDGIGFQSHVYESDDTIDAATLRRHIRTLASMGLQSRVSEMDVSSDEGSARQAAQYRDIFSVCITEPSCVSWTTWGVSNRYDMWSDHGRLAFGKDLLWNDRMEPTPAYYQIRNLLSRTPHDR